jgi:hypothetical protein
MQTKITLDWFEVAMASHVGWLRQVHSLKDNRKSGAKLNTAGWTEHCEGACGEYAVAKFLGITWNGSVDTFKADDLPGIQVRTRSKHDYELIVRKHDTEETNWILVTGVAPDFWVRGWMPGSKAKQSQWLRDYGGRPEAYFIPTKELLPMDTFGKN